MTFNEECLTHASLDGKAMFNNVCIVGHDFNIENYIEKYSENLHSIQSKLESILFGNKVDKRKNQRKNSIISNTKKNNKNNLSEKRRPGNKDTKQIATSNDKLLLSPAVNANSGSHKRVFSIDIIKIDNGILDKDTKENLKISPLKNDLTKTQFSPGLGRFNLAAKIEMRKDCNKEEKKKIRTNLNKNSLINAKDIFKSIKINKTSDDSFENNKASLGNKGSVNININTNFEQNNKKSIVFPAIYEKTPNNRKIILNTLEKKYEANEKEKHEEENKFNNWDNSFKNSNIKKNKSNNNIEINNFNRTETLQSKNSYNSNENNILIENMKNIISNKNEKITLENNNFHPLENSVKSNNKMNFINHSKNNENDFLPSTKTNNLVMAFINSSNIASTKYSGECSPTGKNLINFSNNEKSIINFTSTKFKNSDIKHSQTVNTQEAFSLNKNSINYMNTNITNLETINTKSYSLNINNPIKNTLFLNDSVEINSNNFANQNNTQFNSSIFDSNLSRNNLIKNLKSPKNFENNQTYSSIDHKKSLYINDKNPVNIQYNSNLMFYEKQSGESTTNHIRNYTDAMDNNTSISSMNFYNSILKINSIKNSKPQETVREAIPHLIGGIENIANESSDINNDLQKTIKKRSEELQKSPMKSKKYEKEFDLELNLNDVFLYGNNGEGYYMNNEKVFKDAKILNKTPCENILKHRKFFSDRFDLKSLEKLRAEKIISDGLSTYSRENFIKITDFLKETEELKKKNLKEIKKFKTKVLQINEENEQ